MRKKVLPTTTATLDRLVAPVGKRRPRDSVGLGLRQVGRYLGKASGLVDRYEGGKVGSRKASGFPSCKGCPP